MIQVFALQPDLRTANLLAQPLGKIQRRWATHIVGHIVIKIGLKLRVVLEPVIHRLKIFQRRHQGFRHEATAVTPEVTTGIRKGGKVDLLRHD